MSPSTSPSITHIKALSRNLQQLYVADQLWQFKKLVIDFGHCDKKNQILSSALDVIKPVPPETASGRHHFDWKNMSQGEIFLFFSATLDTFGKYKWLFHVMLPYFTQHLC